MLDFKARTIIGFIILKAYNIGNLKYHSTSPNVQAFKYYSLHDNFVSSLQPVHLEPCKTQFVDDALSDCDCRVISAVTNV